ncbi:hypothetical protein BJ508DRAFT_303418 [Ascobolus immersus RN42]|uniref:Chromo domain-containing protein n=1 Tax=Ascobolus immersus RN42 TaxID=1160509 RepID=A0A3N4IFU7_ASCIM|nr:hypothetical protein BJ508DRAFT_303418 [Ascobolus immersus RN42]
MVGPNAAKLDIPRKWRFHHTQNVSKLRFRPPTLDETPSDRPHKQPPPPLRVIRGESEDKVEKIIAHERIFGRGRPSFKFHVKFRDEPLSDDKGWFTYQQLIDTAPAALKDYYLLHQIPLTKRLESYIDDDNLSLQTITIENRIFTIWTEFTPIPAPTAEWDLFFQDLHFLSHSVV